MKFVCPKPNVWNKIYQILKNRWERASSEQNAPPVPLILNGWVFSNDYDKHQRWQETIEWAKQNGVESLIPELAEEEKYCVKEFSDISGY